MVGSDEPGMRKETKRHRRVSTNDRGTQREKERETGDRDRYKSERRKEEGDIDRDTEKEHGERSEERGKTVAYRTSPQRFPEQTSQ
jgi:hypothetical protein